MNAPPTAPSVLVLAHRLEIGGTQTNAIELAAALRDRHGFEVIFFATPGPMLELVREKKLPFLAAPDARFHPSLSRMRALRRAVEQCRPDLIHAWDWWQALEAYYGVHVWSGLPLLVTDMMMQLTRVLPRRVPTTFGIPALRDQAAEAGWRRPELLLPSVDVEANAAGAADGAAFRRRLGLLDHEIAIVSVSRLAHGMKSAPLEQAIAALRETGGNKPLRLVIVGEGDARPRLEQQAAAVNGFLKRKAILFEGALLDPRPAYAGADIILGMGGSSLRGLAFSKPVVVVGSGGFARLFEPGSASDFYRLGMYNAGGAESLGAILSRLADDPGERRLLGQFGRDYVVQHHSLEVLADHLARLGRATAAEGAARRGIASDALRSTLVYLRERRFLCASRDSHPQEKHS